MAARNKEFLVSKRIGSKSSSCSSGKTAPAPFSFQDVEQLILFFTKKGQKVLDPFSGTGSTIKACAVSNRIGVDIELSKHWYDL